MSESKRFVENLKTVILVVLFITTILLLYLVWGNDEVSSIKLSSLLPFGGQEVTAPECGDVLLPAYIALGEGDGGFTLVDSQPEAIQKYCAEQLGILYSGTVQSYSISETQYFQAATQYKSSTAAWNMDIPYQEFCRYNGISGAGSESVSYITSMCVSEAAKDSVMIRDGRNNQYYRLVSEGIDLSTFEWNTEDAFQSVYYPADAILGCPGSALLPVIEYSSQTECKYENEADDSEEKRVEMAEAAFGDTFDFVRRITDDFGNITFMYGYGQKTLTASADGSVEYKAETSGESSGFYGDLQTALNFVAECGGWDSDGVESVEYRLVEADESTVGRVRTSSFGFAPFVRGKRIFFEDGCPIIVRVSNGEVEYYYRNAISIRAFAEGDTVAVSDATNVVAKNASHMYKVMTNDALSPDTDEAFSYVANKIRSISMGYYCYPNDAGMVPCWTLEMEDGEEFFFKLYEGSPLGFSR